MEKVTLKHLEKTLNNPVIICSHKVGNREKTLTYFPLESMYYIHHKDKAVNVSYLAETAINYYNDIEL